MIKDLSRTIYYLCWLVVVVSVAGSLYFSEILHFPPCVLCWYQRILMYPLVAIIPVGILRKDKGLPFYVLPLSLVGTSVAFYHTLLQYGVVPEKLLPCSNGISCATKFINWFGFVNIPLLSLLAFAFISGGMLFLLSPAIKSYWRKNRSKR